MILVPSAMQCDRKWLFQCIAIRTVLCLTSVVLFASSARAKPQIVIQCDPANNALIPFYLYYTTTGNNMWPNYVSIDLYDSTGAELFPYPLEDGNNPILIHGNQIMPPPTPIPMPTGNEADLYPLAKTAVMSVSGEYNGASCPPQTAAPAPTVPGGTHAHHAAGAHVLDVSLAAPRLVPGNPSKRDIWINVGNSRDGAAKVHFLFALFKKPHPDPIEIADPAAPFDPPTPLIETDPAGRSHVFRRVLHNGTSKQSIPPTQAGNSFIVTDLRVDLSQAASTDVVYLDVFVVDLTNNQHWALPRKQIAP